MGQENREEGGWSFGFFIFLPIWMWVIVLVSSIISPKWQKIICIAIVAVILLLIGNSLLTDMIEENRKMAYVNPLPEPYENYKHHIEVDEDNFYSDETLISIGYNKTDIEGMTEKEKREIINHSSRYITMIGKKNGK